MTEPIPNEDVYDHDLDLPYENESDIYSELDKSQENELTIKDFVGNVLKKDQPHLSKDKKTQAFANLVSNRDQMDIEHSTDSIDVEDESSWSFSKKSQDHDDVRSMISSCWSSQEEVLESFFQSPESDYTNPQSVESTGQSSMQQFIKHLGTDTNVCFSLQTDSQPGNIKKSGKKLPESQSETKKRSPSKNRHAQQQRNRKGLFNGDQPTKNLEPVFHRIFFEFMESDVKRRRFLKSHPALTEMKDKKYATMPVFRDLFKMECLKGYWEEFFSKKVLYREIMLAKLQPKTRMKFMPYLDAFEYGYLTGRFEKLTVIVKEQLKMLKASLTAQTQRTSTKIVEKAGSDIDS